MEMPPCNFISLISSTPPLSNTLISLNLFETLFTKEVKQVVTSSFPVVDIVCISTDIHGLTS